MHALIPSKKKLQKWSRNHSQDAIIDHHNIIIPTILLLKTKKQLNYTKIYNLYILL